MCGPWSLTLAESGFLMMVMMWAFEVFLSRLKRGNVETDDPGRAGAGT
jgi:hypothetical protein